MELQKLTKTPLFHNLTMEEIELSIKCFGGYEKTYEKQSFIHHQGDMISQIGIVIKGSVHIMNEDFWGNNSIIANLEEGDMFGEVYAYSKNTPLEVSVFAPYETTILFINTVNIVSPCGRCVSHNRILANLIQVFATKNLKLLKKIEHTSHRTIRNKVLSYLSSESQKVKSNSFSIPFDRQGLADYLGVNRTALSEELSKLKKEGYLSFNKNNFVLNKTSSI